MGKVIRYNAASASSDDERRKTVQEAQKVRTKKKKRKRELTDLHQKIFKSGKSKETKIDGKLGKARNSKRICNRILPIPLAGIYRNGAVSKEIRRSQAKVSLDDLNNARLQGNVLKLLHGYDSKSECIIVGDNSENNPKDPLLDSAIKNILHPTPGGESVSPVLGKVARKKRQCQRDEYTENVGPSKCMEFQQKPPEKRKSINFENLRHSAISRYKELCTVVSSENFERQNFPEQSAADPLTTVKKKLRSIYAESFRSQFLRDMIKRGTSLNGYNSPNSLLENDVPSEVGYYPSTNRQNTELVSMTTDKPECRVRYGKDREENNLHASQNLFLPQEININLNCKRNQVPASHLLFDISSLKLSNTCTGVKSTVESEQIKKMNNMEFEDDDSTDLSDHTSLVINHSTSTISKRTNDIKYFEHVIPTPLNGVERIKDRNKSLLFIPNETKLSKDLIIKKQLIKRKNQSTQTLHMSNNGVKRHPGKCNLKVPQQVKTKGLKHVPAILRRCNNVVVSTNGRMKFGTVESVCTDKPREMLFDATSKQNVLFTPQSLLTEFNGNSKRLKASSGVDRMLKDTDIKDLNVQTCVIGSPSLRNDEIRYTKNSHLQMAPKEQRRSINDIFSNNIKRNANPPIQKTIMFTKKDSRNIGHSLHLNNLIADSTADNSNASLSRKIIPQQREKSTKNICAVHKNCQRISTNCYQSFHCSQNSDDSKHVNQLNLPQMQTVQVQQEPVVCEKVLLKRVQQHPKCENVQQCHNKDQRVCFVVVDQYKDLNNTQNCSNNNVVPQIQKHRTLQNGRFCQEDVADVGILKGVKNLQILPMEERESRINFTNSKCVGNTVLLEEQPIKYLAFDNDSKTQKIPIYMQSNKHVAPVDNVKIISPKVNYRVVSCSQESSQNIIFLPRCEQNNVVYVKQQNLNNSNVSFERCSHPRKMVLYQPECQSNIHCVKDSTNVCEVHVPKQNVVGISSETIAANLQCSDNVKRSRRGVVNWEDLHYRPSHEHTIVNDEE